MDLPNKPGDDITTPYCPDIVQAVDGSITQKLTSVTKESDVNLAYTDMRNDIYSDCSPISDTSRLLILPSVF
jgi:hypothetical protein